MGSSAVGRSPNRAMSGARVQVIIVMQVRESPRNLTEQDILGQSIRLGSGRSASLGACLAAGGASPR